MLVLTRRKNESILIGDNIEVVILEVEGGAVKLGIKASADLVVLRKELVEEIQKENLTATFKNTSAIKEILQKGLKK